jgi:glycerol-3-phosphate dehydrogenase
MSTSCDLLVVGGGINGAGIARDAAGRGLKVLLCEQDDLAAHTSSASTKLIHGGLRYVEQYELNLVRKALQEREVLLRMAPHVVRPLRFVMPHDSHLRPAWMIRIGLFLYDHLSRRRRLAPSHAIDLRAHVAGTSLQSGYSRGFVYSDAWAEDARLVVLNALDAAARGAAVLTRTRCERLTRANGGWAARLVAASGKSHDVNARAVVNATGPWVERFLHSIAEVGARRAVRLVKGSHIIVRKLFDHPYAYIFQNPDRRIIFAIPYEQDFTLIGTTDVEYGGDPGMVGIDAAEIEYLCRMASRYFARSISPDDVLMTYTGVRPLLDDAANDPSAMNRRYTWLPAGLRQRYARTYGTRIERLLAAARSLADLGEEVLPQLYEREIEYLRAEEWALTAQDILWRRTRLGVRLPPGSSQQLDRWLMGAHPTERTPP